MMGWVVRMCGVMGWVVGCVGDGLGGEGEG